MRHRLIGGWLGAGLLGLIVPAAFAQAPNPQSPTQVAPTQVPMPPGMELPAIPAPNAPAAPQPNTAWVQKPNADLVALNKIDEHVAHLSVPVGQTVTFYQLSITVRACGVRPPDQPADSAAYLDITDAHPTQPGFHGWMLSNEPAASMLQHPVYDVRVVGCH